ncbi:MAG: ABC transporter permease [Coriobacteriia bacterium]|nr:ABC transporter permease [Coriobacteriia bacterium]
MLQSLKQIVGDVWGWRKQITQLALFDLKKQVARTALGPFWLFAKRIVYVLVFWFALEIGLKSGKDTGASGAYLVWLASGVFTWTFMQSMLGTGSAIFNKYSYLVSKIKFPLAGIPAIYAVSEGIIFLGLLIILACTCLAFGEMPTIHLIQVPFAIVLLMVFWYLFSLFASMLGALSKDFHNLITTLSQPLFWLSGIIFNISNIHIPAVQIFAMLNPVTFFANLMRDAIYYHTWIWDNPKACLGFAIVFVIQFVATLVVYKRAETEVRDEL